MLKTFAAAAVIICASPSKAQDYDGAFEKAYCLGVITVMQGVYGSISTSSQNDPIRSILDDLNSLANKNLAYIRGYRLIAPQADPAMVAANNLGQSHERRCRGLRALHADNRIMYEADATCSFVDKCVKPIATKSHQQR